MVSCLGYHVRTVVDRHSHVEREDAGARRKHRPASCVAPVQCIAVVMGHCNAAGGEEANHRERLEDMANAPDEEELHKECPEGMANVPGEGSPANESLTRHSCCGATATTCAYLLLITLLLGIVLLAAVAAAAACLVVVVLRRHVELSSSDLCLSSNVVVGYVGMSKSCGKEEDS